MKNHNTNWNWKRSLILLSLSPFVALSGLIAQEDDSEENKEQDVFELSPFTVTSTAVGYYDSTTLAGTRLKGQVRDVGAAIQILTNEFMEDIDADSVNDLMLYATGAESAGMAGNFTGAAPSAGMGVNIASSQNEPHRNLRIRGVGAPDLTRDFLRTSIPMDRYNTERVTINRGSNSILFGLGSPAGILNNTLKRAQLSKNTSQLQYRIGNSLTGEDMSHRGLADFNVVLVDDRLAVRVALLEDDQNYMQEPAFKRDSRQYATVTIKPFKNTLIRSHYERGDVKANSPDPTGPYENLSGYLNAARDLAAAKGAFTPLVVDPYQYALRAEGYPYDGVPEVAQMVATPNLFKTITFVWDGGPNGPSYGIQPSIPGGHIKSTPDFPPVTGNPRAVNYRSVENVGRQLDTQGYNFQGVLDFELFDFAENLISGRNGFQNRQFENYNVALEQTLLNGDLGFELVYDFQTYSRQSFNPYRANFSAIRVDMNETLPDGRVNPNLGRPFVLSRAQVNLADNTVDSEVYRATGFYRLDFDKVLGDDSRLARILGQHTFTGVIDKYEEEDFQVSESEGYFGTPDMNLDSIFGIARFPRTTSLISYIGPAVNLYDPNLSMEDFTIDLDMIAANNFLLDPGAKVDDVIYFNRPANELQNRTFDRLKYTQDLRYAETEITSYAATWQGHMFNRHIVPTVGWRKDEVSSYIVNATPVTDPDGNPLEYELDWDNPAISEAEESGVSWGVVVYWPDSIIPMPGDLDVSFHYNSSENFFPDAGRFDPWGNNLPAPTGYSEDYGITVSMFDNKLVAKVNWFEAGVNDKTNGRLANIFRKSVYQMGDTIINEYLEAQYELGSGEIDPELYPNYDQVVANLEVLKDFYGFDIVNNELVLDPNVENSKILQLSGATLLKDPATGEITGFDMPFVGELNDTQDTSAKGVEIEIVYNPSRNWRIALNVAKIRSQTSNSIPRLTNWIENEFSQVINNTAISGLRMYDPSSPIEPSSQTVADWWETEVLQPRNAIKAYDGIDEPETRLWRMNLVTNYNFRDGALKGFGIGGAFRWQDNSIIGNAVIPFPDGSLGPDVNRPYYGPEETNVDLWLSYGRKIFNNKVQWSIRLNVKNVFYDKSDLIPIATQPDGSWAEVRVSPPRVFTITNNFKW